MRAEDRYDSLFQFFGWEHHQDWLLLKSQVKAESNFNPYAVSRAGAKGLAQFMDPTFAEWSQKLKIKNADAFNPEHSILCQAAYMHWLQEGLDGKMLRALAAYNWGIGNLKKVIAELNEEWKQKIPAETKHYIDRINSYYDQYLANGPKLREAQNEKRI